jgi:hypothetical protein
MVWERLIEQDLEGRPGLGVLHLPVTHGPRGGAQYTTLCRTDRTR